MQAARALSLALLTLPTVATAADITWAPPITDLLVEPFPNAYGETSPTMSNAPFADGRHIRLEGEIEPGDSNKLGLLLREALPDYNVDMFNNVVVSLNSDGGDFYEGLMLAGVSEDFAVSTYVGAGDRCLSSCAIAFLGGLTNYVRGFPKVPTRYLHVEATLGFHSPFSDLPAVMQIPEGTPFSEGLGGQIAAQFYGQAQSAINEIAQRMEQWHLASGFVFQMLSKGSVPGDTRQLDERFVLVNNYAAVAQIRALWWLPQSNGPAISA